MTSTIVAGQRVSTPLLVTGYQSVRKANNVFNDVLGGGLDTTLSPAGLRTGTLVLLFANETDAAACEGMHTGTEVLRFNDSDYPSIIMNYVPSGSITRALDDQSRTYWTLSIDFQEVTL